jgi:L-ascorbate metabolism protein UlaG (beta-lactamase superfamily)
VTIAGFQVGPFQVGPMRASLIIGVFLLMASNLSQAQTPAAPTSADRSAPREDGQYRNQATLPRDGFLKKLRIGLKYLFLSKPADTRPAAPLPVRRVTPDDLASAPDNSLWRLGHSTVLLKVRGHFFLTDPVFSERASPVQWAGPKRFHAPPIILDELPPIKAVLLSHDHYDHLDHATILHLAARVGVFLTPLGVGDRLIAWGVPAHKVRQLDWWQATEVEGTSFVATPSQHFSGRGLSDSNSTLWASWVMIEPDWRLFFSGDSGYFPGFEQIGERYGPFDLTLVETGAYNRNWPNVHMQPEQSLQAHLDLRGRWLLPIHNGTFDLAMHPWQEPFERIVALADHAGVPVTTPMMGERVSILAPQAGRPWWQAASELRIKPGPASD